MIKIQPKQKGQKLPYPYFINDDGSIGRQDFWKGKPKELIGFSPKSINSNCQGQIDISVFLKDPQKAIGMYPIMVYDEDGTDKWYTHKTKIDSIEII